MAAGIIESNEFEWPADFHCPIFKDICFRDMTDPKDRIQVDPDRCPCQWFTLGNQESRVGGLL